MQADQPVTTILKIRYKDGLKRECLQWMQETASIAGSFEGFIERGIYVSAETDREMIHIFTFRNHTCLQVWENSEERINQSKRNAAFVEAIQSKSHWVGLQFMFPSVKPPRRWKMVVITVGVIFILLNSLVPVLQQVFTSWCLPLPLKSLFGVIVMVGLMTFVILPLLSKVLGRWLAR